ncbi:triacylglycerol lipase 2 [Phoenix dactylifera]|uniref:Lipase n=1 Tax=Phoenix dactylifera TaxID=42345 RepID=A0A8B7CME6_PHODC|nr:triacylglycerol lipase 2 [Phoenix dactylifera]
MGSHGLVCAMISILLLLAFQLELVGARVSHQHELQMNDRIGTVVPPPEMAGTCASVIIPQGYKCEEYEVTTEDGYILSMQRIPVGRIGGGGARRQPVLLQHGVLMDGVTWVLNSPEESLAYILADNGFDVWIANTRGTKWSRRHVSLTPSNPAYWHWSWDELVTYDLPATFNFVYQQTGQKLHYVGHSLGTLIALASVSEGRLVDKLMSAALLSPVAYLSHMTTPIGILAARAFVDQIVNWLGVAEFNPKGPHVAHFLDALCLEPGVDCYNLLQSFTGNNCCLNASTVELFLEYEPQSTATRTMVHLAQTFRDGIITKYNYENREINIENYGQSTPPIYNMSNIPNNLPLFFSYGGRDSLSDVHDVELLLDNLKFHDGDKLTVQFVEDYAHADFVMAVNAAQIVYNAVMAFFNRQ